MHSNSVEFIPRGGMTSQQQQQHTQQYQPQQYQPQQQYQQYQPQQQSQPQQNRMPNQPTQQQQQQQHVINNNNSNNNNNNNSFNSFNGMNTQAKSYIPGMETIESMVQVNYNNNEFYVQESVSDAYTEQYADLETPDDMGFGDLTTVAAPTRKTFQVVGIPDNIRHHFQLLDIESLKEIPPNDERYKEIPIRYQSVNSLDETMPTRAGGSYGYPSSTYKVVDRVDSMLYTLKRFDNVRTTPSIIKSVLSKWINIKHANIVQLHNIYQDKGALFFTHAYHPAALSLKYRFIDQRGALVNEALLWRFLIQLISAVRVVHGNGMAIRNVSLLHIILTSGTVLRITGSSIYDIIEFESRKSLQDLQSEDLVKLGHVILSVASRTVINNKNIEQALQMFQQHFTPDLNRIVGAILGGKATVSQICYLMSDRIHDELDSTMNVVDSIHANLRSEYESSRLTRLLIKLNLVNERPENIRSPQWSETGDRYVLKLFRDYVFHQMVEDSVPSLEIGHILSSLNKLDAGDNEKILLSSRDGKDLLIVSYADIRRCLDSSILELLQMQQSTGYTNTMNDGNGYYHLQQQQQQQPHQRSNRNNW